MSIQSKYTFTIIAKIQAATGAFSDEENMQK